jgi:5,5'-dehydrodivanillate O-demethylase
MVSKKGKRSIQVLPIHNCNWLQAQENSHDPTHTSFLHARMMTEKRKSDRPQADVAYFGRPIEDYDFELCNEPAWTGIRKIRTFGGDRPERELGHPAIFPNILVAPHGKELVIHWRVPMDDTHTAIYWLEFVPTKDGSTVEQSDHEIPITRLAHPLQADGEYELTTFPAQDLMAWETQGSVFDRTQELIGRGDRGIVMYRSLLKRQIEVVQAGREPAGVIRDPRINQTISFAVSEGQALTANAMEAAPAK